MEMSWDFKIELTSKAIGDIKREGIESSQVYDYK